MSVLGSHHHGLTGLHLIRRLARPLLPLPMGGTCSGEHGVGLAKKDLPPYTGGRFELFDGGGDRAETYARFTVSDIFAVQLLSVDIPAVIALDLIDGSGTKLSHDDCLDSGAVTTLASAWAKGSVSCTVSSLTRSIIPQIVDACHGACFEPVISVTEW